MKVKVNFANLETKKKNLYGTSLFILKFLYIPELFVL